MGEETSSKSHLSVVMTTNQDEVTQTTGVTSSSSRNGTMYFEHFVVVIGVIITAANGLVLYALVASKQHKKQMLIVNQNALDLYSCLFLVITYAVRLANIHLTGSLGYWLCMFISSENLFLSGSYGSSINLTLIAIERYLKVCHNVWSKKNLRKWMIYMAMFFAWISGFVFYMPVVFESSVVINGVCYGFVSWDNPDSRMAATISYWLSSFVVVILISVFCYGKILMAIRRQARVMTSHNPAGSSTAQTQLSRIQTSAIKTMILVCAFFAIAWLPEKIFVLLVGLGLNANFLDSSYYVALFLGFLYLCANPFIYAIKFDPVRRILKGLILCKDVSEPVSEGVQMN